MNKKIIILFFICLISLLLVLPINATDINNNNLTSHSDSYQITDEMSNDDIQMMFDTANDGDTFEFNSKEYNNISLVVDKKLHFVI